MNNGISLEWWLDCDCVYCLQGFALSLLSNTLNGEMLQVTSRQSPADRGLAEAVIHFSIVMQALRDDRLLQPLHALITDAGSMTVCFQFFMCCCRFTFLQHVLEHQIRPSTPSSVISRPTCFSSSLRCCWQVCSAPFVQHRCDCSASSAPFTNIQTYLLTFTFLICAWQHIRPHAPSHSVLCDNPCFSPRSLSKCWSFLLHSSPCGSGSSLPPSAGVDRIGPLHFLARCCKRRRNQTLSVLCLSIGILSVFSAVCEGRFLCIVSLHLYVFCLMVVLVKLSVLAKCDWLKRLLWKSLFVW